MNIKATIRTLQFGSSIDEFTQSEKNNISNPDIEISGVYSFGLKYPEEILIHIGELYFSVNKEELLRAIKGVTS